MKILVSLAILLLLIPLASAGSFTIIVQNQDANTFNKKGQEANNEYTFQLVNPPFNLTPTFGNYTNESLYEAKMSTTFLFEKAISTTQTYEIKYIFNDTENYLAQFTYEKHGFSIFSYWNLYFSLSKNGIEVCTESNRGHLGAAEIKPNPYFIFDFALRGSYNSVTFFSVGPSGKAANVSGEVLYSNPSLNLAYGDRFDYVTDIFNAFQVSSINCTTDSNVQTLGGAVFDESVLEITSAPIIIMSTTDLVNPYTHSIQYKFANATYTIQETKKIIEDINAQQASCLLSISFICISDLFETLFRWTIGLALKPIDWILSFIPLYGDIKAIVSTVFNSIVGLYKIVLVTILLSGPNFPIGGVAIALLVWAMSLGFILWGLTGNPMHIIGLPYWGIKGFIWLVVILTFGLWVWLPMKGVELVTRVIQNIRG